MDGSHNVAIADVVVGRILAISGAQITAQLDASKGLDDATALQIGTLVKTQTPNIMRPPLPTSPASTRRPARHPSRSA